MQKANDDRASRAPVPSAPVPPQPQEEKLVGYPDVCEALGLCRHTVLAQMKRGKIPYFKFGKAVRFRLSDVRAKIELTCQRNAPKRHLQRITYKFDVAPPVLPNAGAVESHFKPEIERNFPHKNHLDRAVLPGVASHETLRKPQ